MHGMQNNDRIFYPMPSIPGLLVVTNPCSAPGSRVGLVNVLITLTSELGVITMAVKGIDQVVRRYLRVRITTQLVSLTDGTVRIRVTPPSATELVKYCERDPSTCTDVVELDDATSDCVAEPLDATTAHFCESTFCTLLHTLSPA